MSIATTPRGYIERPRPSGLADVIDVILDKGLVIDAYVRVSLIGIEILTIDARIVVASVDTYLRFAEAVNRLDIKDDQSEGLPQLIESMTQGGAESKTKGAIEGVKDKLTGDHGDGDSRESSRSRASSSSRSSKSSSGSRSRSRS
jgi:gas vesicle structural protein